MPFKTILLPILCSASILAIGFWGYKLINLHNQTKNYAKYWAVARGESGGLVYLALGDSAAQGIGASSPEKGYVGIVANQIRKQTHRPVQIINITKSGAKLKDVISSQLPIITKYHPDFITVDIGGNDIRSYDAKGYQNDVKKLCESLPPGTIVADIPYFMHGHWERDSLEASNVITSAAKQNNLLIAPVHGAMKKRGFNSMLHDFAADWFHPNDVGYRVWASAFEPSVDIRLAALAKEI